MAKKNNNKNNQSYGVEIRVRGLVQGVGFRPTVWQLATQCNLLGEVLNDGEGVLIHLWGHEAHIKNFLIKLPEEKPPLSRIDAIECTVYTQPNTFTKFTISESVTGSISTSIIPDAATCDQCLQDITDSNNHRHRHSFTNCTHCGPRLSITRSIPYDRENTSMADFEMCEQCQEEFSNPADRRFHAQPNACPKCGPHLWLCKSDGKHIQLPKHIDVISYAAILIDDGHILAIKGIGGYHLSCNAANDEAVSKLRQRKRRYGKPLALMASSIAMIKQYAVISECAEQSLKSTSAPIVLLPRKPNGSHLSKDVAPNQTTLGFMLPYTPLHHLLLSETDTPLVMTSGNLSNEPQVTDNNESLRKLAKVADYWLMHDRDIINRLDDSIVQEVNGHTTIVRRARGYAPEPLVLPTGFENTPDILAMGAQLKNTFCILNNGKAIVSQHIGDLEDTSAHSDYRKAQKLYKTAYKFKPKFIAVDLHPDYFSTRWGEKICSDTDAEIKLERVQHHHAHVAACLAEHQYPIESKPVLGIVLDGLGFGENDELWGGEFLVADYKNFKRVLHFQPVAIPGGAKASYETWRNTYAHLQASIGWKTVEEKYGDLDLIKFLQSKPISQLKTMIENNLNAPEVSSAGRLFDAVAGALAICDETIDFEGQAAMELQALAENYPNEKGAYDFEITDRISWGFMWQGILDDLQNNCEPAKISTRFHNTLIKAISKAAIKIAKNERLETVVLSGGVFQNSVINEGIYNEVTKHGLKVITPKKYPANDGGISLGQAVICAARYAARSCEK